MPRGCCSPSRRVLRCKTLIQMCAAFKRRAALVLSRNHLRDGVKLRKDSGAFLSKAAAVSLWSRHLASLLSAARDGGLEDFVQKACGSPRTECLGSLQNDGSGVWKSFNGLLTKNSNYPFGISFSSFFFFFFSFIFKLHDFQFLLGLPLFLIHFSNYL